MTKSEICLQAKPSILRVRNYFNAIWQQRDCRNWAAEFGDAKIGDEGKKEAKKKTEEKSI